MGGVDIRVKDDKGPMSDDKHIFCERMENHQRLLRNPVIRSQAEV